MRSTIQILDAFPTFTVLESMEESSSFPWQNNDDDDSMPLAMNLSELPSTKKEQKQKKRIVYLLDSKDTADRVKKYRRKGSSSSSRVESVIEVLPNALTRKKQKENPENDYPTNILDRTRKKECVPMHDWQTQVHPSCNSIHELYTNILQLEFWGEGSYSHVSKVSSNEIRTKPNFDGIFAMDKTDVVLKRMQFERDVNEFNMEMRRKEVAVHDHLTSSPFVAILYGHCGTSVIAPVAQDGSLHDYLISVRKGGIELTPQDKLKVAIHMAEGLAVVHGSCDDNDDCVSSSFAHNDIDENQYVLQDGLFQINDFNYGLLLYRNTSATTQKQNKMGETCFEPLTTAPYEYRSPEILAYVLRDQKKPFAIDKTDVFSLGTAMYKMLTNRRLLWKARRKTIFRKLMDGKRPSIPSTYLNDFATAAIVEAIQLCWIHNPEERPTARQVANHLMSRFYQTVSGDDIAGTVSKKGISSSTSASISSLNLLEWLRIELPEEDGDDDDDDDE